MRWMEVDRSLFIQVTSRDKLLHFSMYHLDSSASHCSTNSLSRSLATSMTLLPLVYFPSFSVMLLPIPFVSLPPPPSAIWKPSVIFRDQAPSPWLPSKSRMASPIMCAVSTLSHPSNPTLRQLFQEAFGTLELMIKTLNYSIPFFPLPPSHFPLLAPFIKS